MTRPNMDAPYGGLGAASNRLGTRPINLTRLMDMHACGEKIAAVSAHDATIAVTASRAGVECILVGEDLAASYQGHASHADITLDALAYHVENIARGLRSAQASAWIMSDLPANSYGASRELAMRHAGRLCMAGAQMLRVKVDENFAATAGFLVERGVPICGHLINMQKPFIASHIASLGESGARFLMLECMENESVLELKRALPQLVTLGLNSGLQTSGQLVSMNSLLGVNIREETFAGKTYLFRHGSIQLAIGAYVADVKADQFEPDAV